MALSLSNWAELYRAQGKHAKAEPLFEWSLAINEKVLGPEHPNVARSLAKYAALRRATGRIEEANRLEARAEAIREMHARENPAD